MIIYQFRLPFPVSVNQIYGGGSGQKRFPSKKYKSWLASCPKLHPAQIDYPVNMEYIFSWPDNRDRDISNYIKGAEDYIVKSGVLKDDNWKIVSSILIRHAGVIKEHPGVEVIIRSVE